MSYGREIKILIDTLIEREEEGLKIKQKIFPHMKNYFEGTIKGLEWAQALIEVCEKRIEFSYNEYKEISIDKEKLISLYTLPTGLYEIERELKNLGIKIKH